MSNYRDDMNDTAVISDRLWAGLRSLAESTARVGSMVLTGVALLLADSAVASDAVTGRTHSVLVGSAQVSDQVLGTPGLRTLVVDSAKVHDVVRDAYRLLLQDGALAGDAMTANVSVRLSDTAHASDEVVSSRTGRTLVQDGAKAKGTVLVLLRTLVQDGSGAAEACHDRLHARTTVQETAQAGDELLGTATQVLLLVDQARADSQIFDALHARNVVVDAQTVAHDELLSPGMLVGQAWTASTSGWAMSRYAPFAFTGLAVVNGVLYATGPDGVYALDGDQEEIDAQLRTGQLDMTGSVLALPVESHIEYELRGKAWLDVTQTQSGQRAQTYSYPLNARPGADVLTNARFVLGRGLRGRHFGYTLRLKGQHAYINDWTVLTAASKRSI